MKYKAHILLHKSILDNAGNAVTHALQSIGFTSVLDTRIGKILYFSASSDEEAELIIKSQTNEVMEYYEIERLEQWK